MKRNVSIIIALLFLAMITQSQVVRTVGGVGAHYETLKQAFDAVNAGTLTGVITLQLTGSTSETASAGLRANGTGSANYSSLLIYPTTLGLTISGAIINPVIDLIGADHVTIDGRVNQEGSVQSLTIANTSISNLASAVRFITSAENNVVKYCTLKSSCTSSGVGTIHFSSSQVGNGNDNNVIEYCNITNSGGNRPVVALFTSGSTGRENSGNIVRNNNFYDNLRSNSYGYGIMISYNSTNWLISGNSFYETSAISPTGANKYYLIYINTGTNTVSGNFVGGTEPGCAGSPMTIGSNFAHYFCGIFVNGELAEPCVVENNWVANIHYTSSEDNPWDGIYINLGNVNVTGNTIGSPTGTNSIVVTVNVAVATTTISGGSVNSYTILDGGEGYTTPPAVTFSTPSGTVSPTATATISGGKVTALNFTSYGSGYLVAPSVIFDGQSNNYSTTHGMIQNSSSSVNIEYNNIGSITTIGSNYYSHGFESVYVRSVTGTTTLASNLIGSLTTENSINVSSSAVSSLLKQDVYGLYSASLGTTIITGNTVANLNNAYQGLLSGSRARGIQTITGSNTIQNNLVYNISTSSKQSTGAISASVIGISQTSGTALSTQTVSGNTVYNLSNTNPTDRVFVTGIFYSGPSTATNLLTGNFVHSLSISQSTDITSTINGIEVYNGNVTCANNIISLSPNSLGYKINGIWEESNSASYTKSILFNTVYIGGTVTSGASSATSGLWSNKDFSTRNYRNNILFNDRTGGTGAKHYALYLNGKTGLTNDYNDYYSTSGPLGRIVNTDYTSLDAAWKSASGGDANSLSVDPLFTDAGGFSAINYYPSASLPGVSGTGIINDFYHTSRGSTPKMGALEENGNVWQGTVSSDFADAGNWSSGSVPVAGEDIFFATNPANHCNLDSDRVVGNVSNGSSKNLVVNGYKLTINENLNFTGFGKVVTSAPSSVVAFSGTSAQSVSAAAFYNSALRSLEVNNSNGLSIIGDLQVDENLVLTTGTLTIGANSFIFSGSTISRSNGSIDASNASATLIFSNASGINLPAALFTGSVHNLTLTTSGGVTIAQNLSLTGTLSLGAANPSSTKGLLDMSGGFILTMGADAATVGIGDVTGIVKRIHSFATNIPYTFGSQFTTFSFMDDELKPEWISLQISIGTVPGWSSWSPLGKVARYYNIAVSANSSTSQAVVNMRYLPSELESGNNDESKLVFWHKYVNYNGGLPHEHGKSNQSFEDHTIGVTGILLGGAATTNLLESEIAMAYSSTTKNTWKGEVAGSETKWEVGGNWSADHVPLSTEDVLIPSGLAHYPSLTASSNATAQSIEIESGASISANDFDITITGYQGAWINDGNFFAGTGKVTFNHGIPGEIVTMSGSTNFYNIEAGANTTMQPVAGCIVRIAGQGTATETSIVDFSTIENTVEYNGANQTIVNPVGLNGNTGYYNLILSGSGTKLLSASTMPILGDFTITGTALVVAAGAVNTTGNMSIGPMASYTAGSHVHTMGSFNIASDESGTGSLIQSTTFSGNVERYIPNDFKWHFLSSPVSAQPVWPEFAPAPAEDPLTFGPAPWAWDFYYWNPRASTTSQLYWVNLRQDQSGKYNSWPIDEVGSYAGFGATTPYFTVGRGYLVAYTSGWNPTAGSPEEHVFAGNLNAGDVERSIIKDANSFNLVGNPFASSVDWGNDDGWLRGDLSTNTGGGYDYWIFNDGDGYGNYGVYNSLDGDGLGTNNVSRYIAPMQAFFVKAATTGTLTFKNAGRVHSSQTWLKDAEGEQNTIRVKLTTSANNFSDEMILKVNSTLQNSGTQKFWSIYSDAPEIYSMSEQGNYSITRLSTVDENTVVALGVKAGANANYTLTITGTDLFFYAKSILLEDLKTGATQELITNPIYSFTARTDDPAERFHLHFGGPFGIENPGEEPLVKIYSQGSVICVDFNGKPQQNCTLSVYNLLGQKILGQEVCSITNRIDSGLPSGIYITCIVVQDHVVCKKIYLQNQQ